DRRSGRLSQHRDSSGGYAENDEHPRYSQRISCLHECPPSMVRFSLCQPCTRIVTEMSFSCHSFVSTARSRTWAVTDRKRWKQLNGRLFHLPCSAIILLLVGTASGRNCSCAS